MSDINDLTTNTRNDHTPITGDTGNSSDAVSKTPADSALDASHPANNLGGGNDGIADGNAPGATANAGHAVDEENGPAPDTVSGLGASREPGTNTAGVMHVPAATASGAVSDVGAAGAFGAADDPGTTGIGTHDAETTTSDAPLTVDDLGGGGIGGSVAGPNISPSNEVTDAQSQHETH